MEKIQWIKPPTCYNCKTEYSDPLLWCPKCQGLVLIPSLNGPPASRINLHSMWDLSSFLPRFSKPISLFEGATPIISINNNPKLQHLQLKLEFRNPTNSFRDRASSLIISDAVNRNSKLIIDTGTGSFNISLAAYSAFAKINCITVIPQHMELSKIEQLKIYGTDIITIEDTLEKAGTIVQDMIIQKQGYFPQPNNNLLTIEGQKTIGLELALQCKDLDAILIPRGSGSLLLSTYRGLNDALSSGWIEKIPPIYAVSLKNNSLSYLVESLETTQSPFSDYIRKIIGNTKGKELDIDPTLMIDDAFSLAKSDGLFIEPASASVLSAAQILVEQGTINLNSSVAILTSSGLNAMNVFASQMRKMKKVVWGISPGSTAKFELLNLIAENRMSYGYGLWTILQKSGKKRSYQSIYQHLTELEQKGLISFQLGEKQKKKYSLTKKGFEILEKMRDIITSFSE